MEAQTYLCHIRRPVICWLQPLLPPVQGVAAHMHRPMSPMQDTHASGSAQIPRGPHL